MWDDQLYVSFSHRINRLDAELAAYAKVDMLHQSLILQRVFEEEGVQKNWGYFQQGDQHLILHSTLPCTIIYEHDIASGTNKLAFKACYTDSATPLGQPVKDEVYMNITQVHNSGHPVPWPKESDEAPDEYLLVVHNKITHVVGGYGHWLLRMDAKSLRLTHVSHGIVFGHGLSYDQGQVPAAVIIGSCSVVTLKGRHYLSIFGGQGDEYAVHDHIGLRRVRWLNITTAWKMEVEHSPLAPK